MKHLRFLIVAALCLAAPAAAYWNSRGSGYNVSVVAATYQGPGDIISYQIWYGLRAYSAAKVGTKVANICNAGDANCADVNSLANGDFDVATAQGSPLNCGGAGGTCTIKTLYNQVGGTSCSGATACDVTNATAGVRPTLAFSVSNGKACAQFTSASSQILATSGTLAQAQPISMTGVAERTANFTTANYIIQSASGSIFYFTTSANQAAIFSGTANAVKTANDSVLHRISGLGSGVSSFAEVDGSAGSTTSAGTNGMSGIVRLGGSSFLTGYICEAGEIASDASASFGSLDTNEKNYYGL